MLDQAKDASGELSVAATWRQFFRHWPAGLPQRGVLVTMQNDQVPFIAIMTSPELLLLERPNPDVTGARRVLVAFSNIAAVKFTDVLDARKFKSAGFKATGD